MLRKAMTIATWHQMTEASQVNEAAAEGEALAPAELTPIQCEEEVAQAPDPAIGMSRKHEGAYHGPWPPLGTTSIQRNLRLKRERDIYIYIHVFNGEGTWT